MSRTKFDRARDLKDAATKLKGAPRHLFWQERQLFTWIAEDAVFGRSVATGGNHDRYWRIRRNF
jgi:hypothetical protein